MGVDLADLLAHVETPGEEAALRLLDEHGVWLSSALFVRRAVDDGRVNWRAATRLAEHPATQPGDGAVLLIAAELAGHATGVPFGHLVDGLAEPVVRLVLDAVRGASGLGPATVLRMAGRQYGDDDF